MVYLEGSVTDGHLHLEGATNRLRIENACNRKGIHLDGIEWPTSPHGRALHDFTGGFLPMLATADMRTVSQLLAERSDGPSQLDFLEAVLVDTLEKLWLQGVSRIGLRSSAANQTFGSGFPIDSSYDPGRWVRTLTNLEGYYLMVDRVLRADPRFCTAWENPTDKQMQVVSIFTLRRELWDGELLTNDTLVNPYSNGHTFLKTLIGLYERGLIAFWDIAGYEQIRPLSDFLTAIAEARESGLETLVHVAETARKDSAIAYSNIRTAIDSGVLVFGHAVRLFDENELARGMLEEVIENRRFIEYNHTSNYVLGCVGSDEFHPICRALLGFHPLFERRPELLAELRRLIVVTSDDPVTFRTSIQEEYKRIYAQMVAVQKKEQGFVNYDSTDEIMAQLKHNAMNYPVFTHHTHQKNGVVGGETPSEIHWRVASSRFVVPI